MSWGSPRPSRWELFSTAELVALLAALNGVTAQPSVARSLEAEVAARTQGVAA